MLLKSPSIAVLSFAHIFLTEELTTYTTFARFTKIYGLTAGVPLQLQNVPKNHPVSVNQDYQKSQRQKAKKFLKKLTTKPSVHFFETYHSFRNGKKQKNS